MTDTPETIQAALDDLKRQTAAVEARVAAFEKAQRAKVEPRTRQTALDCMRDGYGVIGSEDHKTAYAEIIHLRRELARLKEGLSPKADDVPSDRIALWATDPYGASEGYRMAREIQRHRALVAK